VDGNEIDRRIGEVRDAPADGAEVSTDPAAHEEDLADRAQIGQVDAATDVSPHGGKRVLL